MNKIIFSAGLIFTLSVQAFGCLCSQQISEAFQSGFQPTIDDIRKIAVLTRETKEKVDEGNDILDKETNALKKILAVEKENVVDRKEIIYELKRKNSLM